MCHPPWTRKRGVLVGGEQKEGAACRRGGLRPAYGSSTERREWVQVKA